MQRADAGAERAIWQVSRVLQLPGLQGDPAIHAADRLSAVRRGRVGRAPDAKGKDLLWLRPLSRVHVRYLGSSGEGDLPLMRVADHGPEAEQDEGRLSSVPEVQDSGGRGGGGRAEWNARRLIF